MLNLGLSHPPFLGSLMPPKVLFWAEFGNFLKRHSKSLFFMNPDPPFDQDWFQHCCLQELSPTSNRDTEKRLSTGSDISGSSLDKILERSDDHKRVASSQGESSEDMKTRRYV